MSGCFGSAAAPDTFSRKGFEPLNLLYRYVSREVLKFFSWVLILVVGIFVAVDYIGTMDEFIQSKIPLTRALMYVLLRIPFVITQFIPVALLLAVLIVFGLMAKNNELIILKSSGISTYALIRPMLVIAGGLTLALLFIAEFLAPVSTQKSNEIKYREIRKETVTSFKKENIWLKDKRRIIFIKHFQISESAICGVTIYAFDENFLLVKRTDAERGVYQNGRWSLYGAMTHSFDKTAGNYTILFHDALLEAFDFSPGDLQEIVKKSTEMNFQELRAYIHKVEEEGYDATNYRVDLYSKTAFPFVCVIMCLIGISLSVRGKLDKGLAVSISYGIGIAFLYWVFYSFCLSLGYGGLIPPFLAAWVTNLIFLCFGMIYLLKAE